MGACMSTNPPSHKPKNPPKSKLRTQLSNPNVNSQGMDHPKKHFTQQILLPSYFYPGSSDWVETLKSTPAVGICIINPNSGPGKRADPNYVSQTKAAQTAGVKMLGYVHTSYGKRELALMQSEIDKYFEWYNVDGIFLDEIPSTRSHIHIYERIHRHIAAHPNAITVINPGTHPCEAYFSVADIICNFEDGYHNYVSTYSTPEWIVSNQVSPERILHIVHSVPGPDQLQQVMDLSRMRRAGYVFITSEKMPNPYGKLPQHHFWQAKINNLREHNAKPVEAISISSEELPTTN